MEQGSYNPVQNMGHKGPVLRLRCIGPVGARNQISFIHSFIPTDATPHASHTETGVKVHGTRFLPCSSINRAHVSSERVPTHHTVFKHTVLTVFLATLRYVKKSNLTIGDSTIIRLLNDKLT
jgi:hypothetical protein